MDVRSTPSAKHFSTASSVKKPAVAKFINLTVFACLNGLPTGGVKKMATMLITTSTVHRTCSQAHLMECGARGECKRRISEPKRNYLVQLQCNMVINETAETIIRFVPWLVANDVICTARAHHGQLKYSRCMSVLALPCTKAMPKQTAGYIEKSCSGLGPRRRHH